uniref:Uncharacterized protein n=1 Tax=Haemonchus contortus TaxID=6289 RepID=A0A7I5E6X4_HAECO|nr:unnamed protein product [Haemonchus contortus]
MSSSCDISTASSGEITLSPPSYSMQEDAGSGDLLSRSQQIWPNRPEFGRYSIEYEYLDRKRIKSEREKREKKRMRFLELEFCQNRAAAGGSTRTALTASNPLLAFCTPTPNTVITSERTVPTSMLLSSSRALDYKRSSRMITSDDLITLGGLLPSARSPDLVPTELLRSSCTSRLDRSLASGSSTFLTPLDDEIRLQVGSAYHFLGSATDQQALSAMRVYPFVVYLEKGTDNKTIKVGFKVRGEARLFTVEMLSIEEGGNLWRITGTTYSIGFGTLDDMAHFYCRFPATAE